MEILKVITHSQGGSNYINNGINYLFDGRCIMYHGYGINPYDANIAAMQFKQNAKFWNNQNKNPFLQCMQPISQVSLLRLWLKLSAVWNGNVHRYLFLKMTRKMSKGICKKTHNFFCTSNSLYDAFLNPKIEITIVH